MSTSADQPQLLKRSPRVGDTILTTGGKLYRVDELYRTPGIRGVHFYAVTNAEPVISPIGGGESVTHAVGSLPNIIEPSKVIGVVKP